MQNFSVDCSLDTLEVGLDPSGPVANPDIAGVGVRMITTCMHYLPLRVNAKTWQVVISFAFSAAMTLVLVVIHYIFEPQNHTQNLVDRAWIEFITPKSLREISIPARKKWTKATTSALLTYSDIQVITGIAILLAGYLQLSYGISVYHWRVVSNLAWFSSVTHIATLTSLRIYFKKRPALAYCRIIAMGINLILLGVASGPANYQDPNTEQRRFYAYPAKCLYEHGHKPELNYLMVAASLIFLITSYTIRVIRISVTCSRVTHEWLRVKPGNWVKKNHSKAVDRQARSQDFVRRKLWCLWKQQLTLSYVVSKALYEVGDSMLWEVCSFDTLNIPNVIFFCSIRLILSMQIIWLLAALTWGIIKLVLRRTEVKLDGEHVWGFGQILSVFLSILPMWSIFGAIYGM